MNQSKRHRTQLAAMGHTVKSVNGEEVGGVQSIMFVAAPRPAHSDEPGSAKRVNGYYRSGSDFRKDGQAVGW
jgi:gamma-glutamyltranspeptidase/glutathione hydrolase